MKNAFGFRYNFLARCQVKSGKDPLGQAMKKAKSPFREILFEHIC